MPISQVEPSESRGWHGWPRVNFSQLRRNLARPLAMDHEHRQRLLDLAQRLARVQDLGDGYVRVGFSEHVTAALEQKAVAV